MPKVHLPDGRVVNFPDSMGADEITRAVEGLAGDKGPTPSLTDRVLADNPAADWQTRAGLWIARGIKAHPVGTAAAVGAGIGTLASGGALAPVLGPAALSIAGAGLGGAAGAGLGMIADTAAGGSDSPTTSGGVLKRMATEGATQAAFQGVGEALPVVGRLVAKSGKRMYGSTLKALRSVQAQNPGKDLVQIGVERNLPLSPNTMTTINDQVQQREGLINQAVKGNASPISLQDSVTAAEGQLVGPGGKFRDLATDRAKVSGTVNDLTAEHPDFTTRLTQEAPLPPAQPRATMTPEDIFARQDEVRAYQAALKASSESAPTLRTVTAPEAQALKQRLYGRVRDASWGELASPQQETLKGVAHQINTRLKEAVPEIAPHLAEQSDLLAFQEALAKALPRLANNNAIPLESSIYLAANPTLKGALLALSRTKQAGDIGGRLLYRSGSAMGRADPQTLANLMRALQVAQEAGR